MDTLRATACRQWLQRDSMIPLHCDFACITLAVRKPTTVLARSELFMDVGRRQRMAPRAAGFEKARYIPETRPCLSGCRNFGFPNRLTRHARRSRAGVSRLASNCRLIGCAQHHCCRCSIARLSGDKLGSAITSSLDKETTTTHILMSTSDFREEFLDALLLRANEPPRTLPSCRYESS